MVNGFLRDAGEQPPRPREVRRLTFETLVFGAPHEGAGNVVPIGVAAPGDRQVALHEVRGEGMGNTPYRPAVLDGLAELPDVESVVGAGYAVARRPLPQIRELAVTVTDEETLANLPNLRTLAIRQAVGDRPLDVAAVAPGLRELYCHARNTFGSVESLARLTELERVCVEYAYASSMKPLAQLANLRWLKVDPGKDVRALGQLEKLEFLSLELESATMSNLKAFAKCRRLRSLAVQGRRLKSLEGVEALEALERLHLYLPGVKDLAPLRGHPALTGLELHHADAVQDWGPLELPALRRLTVELEPPATLPGRDFLRGCPALEDVTMIGEPAGDAPARGPLTPVALPDGTWTIFEDVTGHLGLATNHEAEDLVRAALRAGDPELHERLDFDSEGSALSVSGSEADVRRVGELIRRLAAA